MKNLLNGIVKHTFRRGMLNTILRISACNIILYFALLGTTFSQGTVRWTGGTSTAWETASNWTVVSGAPSTPPASGDAVEIGTGAITNQPTITTATTIASLTYGNSAASTLTINGNLTITGAITNTIATTARVHNITIATGVTLSAGSANLNPAVGAANMTITLNGTATFTVSGGFTASPTVATTTVTVAVGAGTFSVGGATTLGGTATGQIGQVTISTGSATFSGNYTSQEASSGIVFSGAGTVTFRGNFTRSPGLFTASTSTAIFDGAGAQTLTTSANITFNNLTIGSANNPSVTVSGAFRVDCTNFIINGTSSFTASSAGMRITGNISNSGTFDVTAGTLDLRTNATGTITGTGTYNLNNLTMNNTAGLVRTLGTNTTLNISGTVTPSTGANGGLDVTTNTPNTINYNGTTAQTMPAAVTTYHNLTITSSNTVTLGAATTVNGNLLITSGTLDASASNFAITLRGDWTNNGGTFTPRAGTVTFNSTTAAQAINGTAASKTFNNVTVNKAGQTLSVGGGTTTLTLNGTMTLTAGTFSAGTASAINIAGNWTNNGGTYTPGSGTVIFTSTTAAQAINGTAASQTFNNITVNKTGQTLSVGGSTTTLALNGTLTLNAGTFSAGTATSINIAGDWTNNGATFTPSTSTVTFNSTTAAQAINGTAASKTFNNVTVNKAGQTLSVGGGTTTLTLNGTMTLTAGTFSAGTASAINIAGNWTNNGGTYTPGSGTVIFTSTTAAQAINGTAASQTFNNITVNKSGQTLSIGGSTTAVVINSDLTISAGTFDLGTATVNRATSGGTITVSNGATLKIGGTNSFPSNYTTHSLGATSTVEYSGTMQTVSVETYGNLTISGSGTKTLAGTTTLAGNLSINAGTFDLSTFTADRLAAGGTITVANGAVLKIGGTNGFPANYTTHTLGATSTVEYGGTTQTVSAESYGNLTISGSATKTMNGATTVAGDLTLSSGTLSTSASNFNLTVGGNWTNNGGTFSGGTSTVTFTGTAKTIGGTSSTTFPALTVTTGTITMNNDNSCTSFTLANNNVANSFTHGGTSTLTVNGAVTINQASGGGVVHAWNINAGSATVTGNLTISVTAANAGRIAMVVTTTGTLTVQGDVIYNNTQNVANGVIDMSGGAGTLNIGGSLTLNTLGTLTPGTTSTVVYDGTSAQTVGAGSAITYNHLTINKSAGTATLGAATTTNGDLTLSAGTLSTSASNFSLTVGGNWANNGGTFSGGTSTVTFRGSGTQSIGGTQSTVFPNLVITGNGVNNAVTMNNDNSCSSLTLDNLNRTTSFTHAGTAVLTVSGNATINQASGGGNIHSWNINAGSATVTGNLTISVTAANAGRIAMVVTTTGTLTVQGDVIYNNTQNAANGVIDMSGGAGTLNIGGSLTLNTLGTLTPGTTSTVVYDGTGAQTVGAGSAIAYNHLTINKTSGTATLGGNATVDGTLTLTNGTLSIGASTLTINSAISTTGGNLVGGSASNIVIGGTGASTTLPAVALNNLSLNRANGIDLGGNLSIEGTLTLTDGTLNTSAHTLLLTTTGTVANSGNGHIEGTVTKNFLGVETGMYPLMSTNNFIDIQSPGLLAITLRSFPGVSPPEIPPSADTSRAVRLRYYEITGVTGAGTVKLRLDYLNSEMGSQYNANLGSLWEKSMLGQPWVDLLADTAGAYFVEESNLNVSELQGFYAIAEQGVLSFPVIAFSSTSLEFGNVVVGMSKQDSVTVTNTGTSTLNISSVASDNGEYSVTPTSASIAPSASQKFYITFSPVDVGAESGNIVFVHDASGSPDTVGVSGTGVEPGFSVAPTSIAFGNVVVGMSKQDSVTVTNTGTSTLTISSVTSDNGEFSVTPTGGSIPPAGSQKFYITFSPTNTGAESGNITFTHDAPGSPHSVSVSGTGVQAGFSVDPTSVAFGNVVVGMSKQDSVTVTNTGTSTLTISSVGSDNGEFSVTPTSGSIPPSGSQKFYITFSPVDVGAESGNIVFVHDASGSPHNVAVSGTGVAAVFASNLTEIMFMQVPVGTSRSDSFRVYNYGNIDLVISNISSTDPHFVVAPSSTIVNPYDSVSILVTFTPDSVGSFAGFIVMEHNGSTSPDTVRVSGDAVTSVVEYTGSIPEVSQLYQNFPNPFNPSTEIRFDVKERSHVQAIVYDATGRVVDVLVNETMQGPARYTTRWDASNRASGVYFVRLVIRSENNTPTFVAMKKMVLVK
jgi:hypothetical protein